MSDFQLSQAASKDASVVAISQIETNLKDIMGRAAALVHENASNILALKSRSTQIIDNDCDNAVKLRLAAATSADVLNTRAIYNSERFQNFAGTMADIATETDRLNKHSTETPTAHPPQRERCRAVGWSTAQGCSQNQYAGRLGRL